MPDDIHQPKQLLVEGKDAKVYFIEFLKALNISDNQVQDFGGVNELTDFLGQLRKNANFRKMVTSLGIVRDAESDSIGAFQSVQTSLQKASLPIPSNPTMPTNTSLKVNVFILPGNNSPGMLETLLLQAISGDPAITCIDSFIECIEKEAQYTPNPIDKAKALAYLASREQIKPLIGHAARAGYWNFDDPSYTSLKDFVRSL